jgi:hypothetical protein
MGSQAELTSVAMAVGSTVCAQSVPRSESVSWRVREPETMVETSSRSSWRSHDVVTGPTVWCAGFVPAAVGIRR